MFSLRNCAFSPWNISEKLAVSPWNFKILRKAVSPWNKKYGDFSSSALYLYVCLSFYLFYVRSSVSIPIEIGPHPTPPHQQHPPLSLPNTTTIPSETGPKQLRAEMTQDRNDSPT